MASNVDPQDSSPSNKKNKPSVSLFNEIKASVSRFINFTKQLPFREKILIAALIILTFVLLFLLSREQNTVLAVHDGAVEGNIQPPEWLLKWLNSGDKSLQRLNLQCEKVPDNNAAQGWTLQCKNLLGGGDKNQTFFLQLENSQKKSKQPSNETGNSLCCRPCNRTEHPPPLPTPPPPPPPPFIIIRSIKWAVNKIDICRRIVVTSISISRRIIATSISIYRRIVVESVSEIKTAFGIYIHKCQYHSETMSTQFEMELKKMLEKELLRQIKKTKETCKSKACLDRYPNALRYQFKNKFNDLLKTSLHQISLELQRSTDAAAGTELITEQKQYAEVIEHHEEKSVEQVHTEEVIKQEDIVVEESAEVIKHQEIVV